MKTIEIDTAQKVTIQYELASIGNRFLAYFIDSLIVMGVLIFLSILGSQAIHYEVYEYYMVIVILPIFLFYSLVTEILFDGQTIGKLTLGLKVVKLNGDAPVANDYFIRWMFRFIDIYTSVGTVAALLISASPKSQRLGGILSGTTVIRKTSVRSFALKDILKISTLDTYEPKFPKITRFSEQDMLFIKKVLERERRYSNKEHRKAVVELSKHIAEQLSIEKLPRDRRKFLRTLINDYIVLTR